MILPIFSTRCEGGRGRRREEGVKAWRERREAEGMYKSSGGGVRKSEGERGSEGEKEIERWEEIILEGSYGPP